MKNNGLRYITIGELQELIRNNIHHPISQAKIKTLQSTHPLDTVVVVPAIAIQAIEENRELHERCTANPSTGEKEYYQELGERITNGYEEPGDISSPTTGDSEESDTDSA